MIRRLVILAAATLAAGAITTGGTAMATKGQCNPAPDPYNVTQMTKGNGAVFIELGYGWDGVSVFPDCHGPLVGARVTNSGDTTWYAHLQGQRGQPRTVAILPHATRTYSAAQLSSVGLDTVDDIAGLLLNTTP